MSLIIEKGTYKDIDELEQLYDDLNSHLETGINYPGWIKGIYPVRQNAEDGVADGTLYIARQQGKIAGTVILSHKPEPAYHTANWAFDSDYSDIFVVHTLAVHPDYIGCGIGKRLLEFSSQLAKEKNIKSIRLDVYENNLPAIKLYEKCGFKYIGTVDLGFGAYGLHWYKLYEKLI